MTRTQQTRVLAFILGSMAILLAIFFGSGGSPRAPGAAALGGAEGQDSAANSDPRSGEFRRRNPFKFVRAHPPPAPPPAVPRALPKAPPPPTPPPQEPLPLRLVGTMAGDPLGMAFMIEVRNQQQHLFQIGDNLGEDLGEKWRGVVLTEVRRKAVTFSRGEQAWTVKMGEAASAATGARAAAPVASPLGVRPIPSATVAAPAGAPPSQRVVQRAEIEKNLKNLGYLITQLNVQPFFNNGQPSGFRVSRIRPGSFIDKMGARNGDIIQGVNGKPIKTIKDAFLLYNSFKTQKKVNVNILRGGQVQSMGFSLK